MSARHSNVETSKLKSVIDIRRLGVFPSLIEVPKKPFYEFFTAVYNVSSAGLGLLILSPLMLIITAAVKLSSPGPALYRGQRVGRNEKIFNILKFRTMKVGSEAKIGKRLVQQDEDHYTSIGRFLRKYRLDELPQLLNVLKRDMNLVGPRPVRPIFLEDHKNKIQAYSRRFLVRPGITGQAQVRGGYYTSPRHKLFYEMLHISRRNVLFDLQLIVLTFARVMTRIFTATLLLCWLLVMVLVAPPEFQAAMTLSIGPLAFNVLYILPTLIIIVHLAQRRMDSRRVVALQTPTDLPIVAFLVWTMIIIPFSPMPLAATRGLGWWICNGFVVYYLILNSRMVTDRRDALIAVLVGGVALVGLFDLIPTLLDWFNTGRLERIVGYLVNPVLTSVLVTLALPLALVRTVAGPSRLQRRFAGAASLVLGLTGILTVSRAGIVVMGIVIAFTLYPLAKRLMSVSILALVGVLMAFSLNGDERLQPTRVVADLNARLSQQAAVLTTLIQDEQTTQANLVTGVGARVVGRYSRSPLYQDHKPALELSNMYLTILADQGLIGLGLFLLILWRSLRFVYRGLPRIESALHRADLQAATAGVVGCILLFLVSDALYQLPLMLAFFSALGLAVGLTANYGTAHRRVYRIIHYRHNL